MLRIIGGEYRSRVLATPHGKDQTRPMGARTKEAIFNLLRGWFEEANVLDLFAGVGTMGLEAVSRGAARVVMVERDKHVFQLLQANVRSLGCGSRAIPVLADALGPVAVASAPAPVDIVFMDPPFPMMREEVGLARVKAQVAACVPVLKPSAFIVVRSPDEPVPAEWSIPGLAGPEVHHYGSEQWVMLFAPRATT
jgi:16S rRNA (guanine966-N2)-methyltransferase